MRVKSLNELDRYVDDLKERKGRLFSNCYFDREQFVSLIQSGRLEFTYDGRDSLILYTRENGFRRVYLYMTPDADLPMEGSDTLITDLLFPEGQKDAKTIRVEETLQREGFRPVAGFTRWIKEIHGEGLLKDRKDIRVDDAVNADFRSLFLRSFDKELDLLPLPEEMDAFFESCHTLRLEADGRTAGGVIWHKKGMEATEEYIFISPEFRGRGLASYLHSCFIRTAFPDEAEGRIIAWINDDNADSIAFHRAQGYEPDTLRKTSWKRAGYATDHV